MWSLLFTSCEFHLIQLTQRLFNPFWTFSSTFPLQSTIKLELLFCFVCIGLIFSRRNSPCRTQRFCCIQVFMLECWYITNWMLKISPFTYKLWYLKLFLADWRSFCPRSWVFHAWGIPDKFRRIGGCGRYMDIQDSYTWHHTQTIQCWNTKKWTSSKTCSFFKRYVPSNFCFKCEWLLLENLPDVSK